MYIVRFLIKRGREQKLTQVASSLTFTTVLALVPTLAVILALFTAFPAFQKFSAALEQFLSNSLMPAALSDNIMDYFNQFARQASRLTAIGGAFLGVTTIMLLMTIDEVLNDIWHVTRQRTLSQRILTYWAIMTIGPVFAGASLWATSVFLRESWGWIELESFTLDLALSIAPVLLTGMALAGLFVLVPNRQVRWTDAWIGGFATSIVLELMKSAFAYYVVRFSSSYTIIYGAFATIPLFLLWIYLSWLAILCGATLSASLPLVRLGRWISHRCPGSLFFDALDILRTLHVAQRQSSPELSEQELATSLNLYDDELNKVLNILGEMGLIARTQDNHWLLACDATYTSLGPVFDRFLLDRTQPRLQVDPILLQAVKLIFVEGQVLTLEQLTKDSLC